MKKTLFLSLITIQVTFLFSCNVGQKRPENLDSHFSQIDSLDVELKQISDNSIIPGFSVALVNSDSVIFKNSYGFSDVSRHIPFTDNTTHTIASISKTFIGLSIMKLIEEGKLSLNQPINDILPFEIKNPHFPKIPITVKHLVTHSSSINDDFDDGDKRASWLVDPTPLKYKDYPSDIKESIFYYDGEQSSLSDFITAVCTPHGKWYNETNFSAFKPGETYEYSNAGATIAALIVEIISGSSFSSFTEEHIFQPLGMNDTGWFYKSLNDSYSKLYVENDKKVYEFPRYHEASYPDGQLKTTINDLSKYLVEMMKGYKGKGTLLKQESYSFMLHSQLPRESFDSLDESALNDEYDVGVFWGISEPGYRLHSGGMIGVYSIIYFNPETETGVIAFCNLADSSFGSIVNTLSKYDKVFSKKEISY